MFTSQNVDSIVGDGLEGYLMKSCEDIWLKAPK